MLVALAATSRIAATTDISAQLTEMRLPKIARGSRARANDAVDAARGDYDRGFTAGQELADETTSTIMELKGLDKAGWYIVRVQDWKADRPLGFTVEGTMVACRLYWFDPADESVWHRTEDEGC